MKRITVFLLAVVFLLGIVPDGTASVLILPTNPSNPPSPNVTVLETRGLDSSRRLSQRPNLTVGQTPQSVTGAHVQVNLHQRNQPYYGTGGALTHSSAHLFMQMSQSNRTAALNRLFGPNGARFGLVRIPIGSSDYTHTNYFFTHADDPQSTAVSVSWANPMPGQPTLVDREARSTYSDTSLSNFNLNHDADIIAVMQEILAINPEVRVIATPWTAPNWMKTSRRLVGHALSASHEQNYARYLTRFVQEYANRGIPVDYISLINEPLISGIAYPHMDLTPPQTGRIVDHLGPMLNNVTLPGARRPAGQRTKIMAWNHNWNNSNYQAAAQSHINDLMSGNRSQYIGGVGWHGYGGSVTDGINWARGSYPSLRQFVTEICEHGDSAWNSWDMNWALSNIIMGPNNNGSSGTTYWNLALRNNGTPHLRTTDPAHTFGLVDVTNSGITNERTAFHALAHLSRELYPINGVFPTRVGTTQSSANNILVNAFERADGRVVIVAHNTTSNTNMTDVRFSVGNRSFTYNMQGHSIVTFLLDGWEGSNTQPLTPSTAAIINNQGVPTLRIEGTTTYSAPSLTIGLRYQAGAIPVTAPAGTVPGALGTFRVDLDLRQITANRIGSWIDVLINSPGGVSTVPSPANPDGTINVNGNIFRFREWNGELKVERLTAAPNYGDTNNDGSIAAADVTRLRSYIAAQDKTAWLNANTSFNVQNADANGDGFINSADVTLIRRYVAAVDKASVPLGPRP
jgi:glucosylceramidase